MEQLNELSYMVRKAIFNVHNALGPCLFESVYEAAMWIELNLLGLKAESQKEVKIMYKNKDLGLGFRMDILVNFNDESIIDKKSIIRIINTN